MSKDAEAIPQMEHGPIRHTLLRIANVNPQSVLTNSDEVLYCAIGCFMCLYVPYAVLGGAEFIKASQGGKSSWWQWLVGLVVAFAVITFDRAVVGRITTNYANLESDDEGHLLNKPSRKIYFARAAFAVLMAVVITEPIMLARYESDIQERLAQVANATITHVADAGAVPALTKQLDTLESADTAASAAVTALENQAAADNAQGSQLHQQALADRQGSGISGLSGCPSGGECWTLEQESQRAYTAAAAVTTQAKSLQQVQGPAAQARTLQETTLEREIKAAQSSGITAANENKGFGAQSAAMWYLVVHDFWGIGVFYIGTALLLLALDCAAILLKLSSFDNGYERAEARRARAVERELSTASARSTHKYLMEREVIKTASAVLPQVLAEEAHSFANEGVSTEIRTRLHDEVARLVGVENELHRKPAADDLRHSDARRARRRRLLTRSSLVAVVIGAVTAIGFGLLGAPGGSLKSSSSSDQVKGASGLVEEAASDYAAAPTSVIARFRADSAPLLGVPSTETPGSAKQICKQVGTAVGRISQPALLSADVSISNPEVAGLALDERTARMDAIDECLLNNQRGFDADLKIAQRAAKSFDQQENDR